MPKGSQQLMFLRGEAPGYMVPAHIVLAAALPRTPNGKVERGSLPSPEAGAPTPGTPHVGPRTPTETQIARYGPYVLGMRVTGRRPTKFPRLGGDSLKAAQIVTAMRAAFGVDAGMRHLWDGPRLPGRRDRRQSPRLRLRRSLDRWK